MTVLDYVSRQLPYLVPTLLVYLVGVVLSLVQLGRHGKPAAFALVGCGLLFLVTIAFAFIQGYIFVSRLERGDRDVAQWLMISGIVRSVLYITGFSLVLAAVFVGRRPEAAAADYSESRR